MAHKSLSDEEIQEILFPKEAREFLEANPQYYQEAAMIYAEVALKYVFPKKKKEREE